MTQARCDSESIFWEAMAIDSPGDRARFLESACDDNLPLKAEIERLLHAYPQAERFLESPPAAFVPTTIELPPAEAVGTMIGPYKLREVLGEGGMGIVYVAEQERPLRRKVALKVVKPGMDSKEVIARFEAERQALALMDHPNIAKVHDAGTTETGRPFFVMELVRGLPITDYCDQRRLYPRERLKLFITVCQAVQHAHQRGIIHRDLKPSNVMITLHDGTPVPKVIDFGVAKALNQKLTEQTLYTRNMQMVGTPLYMSPEQAELSGLDVDTRSDVYSLGVLLYELLTGHTPFEKETLSKVSFDEMRRIIREDEPARPSHRVSTLAAEVRSTVSNRRGIEERYLTRSLRGELDWIVMKALEKDRTRRYGSADTLAADLQRYLNDQPVEACPPSLGYRLRKLTHRKRSTLTTVLLTAIITGIISAAVIVVVKDREGRETARIIIPDGGSATVTDDEEKSAESQAAQQRSPAAKPRPLAPARGEFGGWDNNRGIDWNNLDDKAVANYTSGAGRWHNARGFVSNELGERDKALADFTKAIELSPKNSIPYGNRAGLWGALKQYDEAVADYTKMIELDPKDWWAYHNRARMWEQLQQHDKALFDYAKAFELDPSHSSVPYELAWFLATCPDARFRDYGRAVMVARKAVEIAPDASSWRLLGICEYRNGTFTAALEASQKAIDLHTSENRVDHNWAINSLFLAMAHWQLGQKDEAIARYNKAVDWVEKSKDEDLKRFRAEAAELLGRPVSNPREPADPRPDPIPPPQDPVEGKVE